MRYDARACFRENSSDKNWCNIAVPIGTIIAKTQSAGFAFDSNKIIKSNKVRTRLFQPAKKGTQLRSRSSFGRVPIFIS